jgi:integrase
MKTECAEMAVLTADEAGRLLAALSGAEALAGRLMYETGMRIDEILGLRVRDVDLAHGTIYVRRTGNSKDRVITLPSKLSGAIACQLDAARNVHRRDLRKGLAADLPGDARREMPLAGARWCWQFIFPAGETAIDPSTREAVRVPLTVDAFSAAIEKAAQLAGIEAPLHSHSLRHACAARWVEQGATLADIQKLMGHEDLEVTARYARELAPGARKTVCLQSFRSDWLTLAAEDRGLLARWFPRMLRPRAA